LHETSNNQGEGNTRLVWGNPVAGVMGPAYGTYMNIYDMNIII